MGGGGGFEINRGSLSRGRGGGESVRPPQSVANSNGHNAIIKSVAGGPGLSPVLSPLSSTKATLFKW
ncbi:hypothetical protein J6590_042970 [Homalodisca vitripennis]|nr:hypothetical protein J6590_042970 [Homalodisca vitripennis]